MYRNSKMTEYVGKAADGADLRKEAHGDTDQDLNGIEVSDTEDSNPTSDSSGSSSGSWSIDDSIEFMQTSHKPLFDELPMYSIRSSEHGDRSISPLSNEPISLFNLSISPISSTEDLSSLGLDQTSTSFAACGFFTKDMNHDAMASGHDDDERVSLEEITAQINTPPSALSRSNKRLNLETIFEDVFFETPKKRRFNGFNRFNSWRIESFQEITSEERINSYVFDQQQNQNHDARPDTTNVLCTAFDDKINLNT